MLKRGSIVVFFGACAVALSACGGGGSGGSGTSIAPSVPVTSQTAAPAATATQSITAAVGGSISVKDANGAGVTVAIPAGALAANAAVTVSLYTGPTGQPFPTGASFLGGFAVDTAGTALLKRLTVTESLGRTQPAGTVVRLARYSSAKSAFTDIDTATFSGTAVKNDDDAKYVGVSSATGTANAYAFYSVAASAAATPAPIALTIVPATPAPYAVGSTLAITATGADANGNPYVYTPTFGTSSVTLGTASATSGTGGTVTFGTVATQGNLTVSDARTGATGTLAVATTTDLPLSAGQSFTYSGNSTETFNRTYPAPMPTATIFTAIQQNGTVKDGQQFNGVSGLYDSSVAETDTTPLQTTTSQTDTYYGYTTPAANGSYALIEYGSMWADSNNDTLTYTYGTPLTLGLLPETGAGSWSNTAAVTIDENDAIDANGSAFYSHRVYAANGTYTETTTYPPGYSSVSDTGTITENADGSGMNATPMGPGALHSAYASVTLSAPQVQTDGSYRITYKVYAVPSPGPSDAPITSGQIPAWYPLPITLYHESDQDLGAQPIPAACNVPASTASSATKIERTINRVDTILGYTDTQTTDKFLVNALGAVCVQMQDLQTLYYDFSGDSQFNLSATPYQTTTTVETLALQSGASTASTKRSTASVSPLSTAAIVAAQMHFNRTVEGLRAARRASVARGLQSLITSRQGGAR
ncbi:MAG TPA: hypothetical protein VMA36_05210 [Candidatus Limnocylindria bacterium]|nr:hypothetical protein [Candidatus Limnocylindria bacterium]